MHVGYITSEYPHNLVNSNAGIGSFTKNTALGLLKKGHEVTVFVYGQNCNETFKDQGVTIHKIAYKKYLIFSWFLYRKQLQYYINRFIKAEKIDVIEAPDWTGITAFMIFLCPIVIRLHGSDTYFCHLESRKVKAKNKFFEKRALLGADKIIGVSTFVSEQTKKLFNLKSNIETIYNTVDTQFFTPNHSSVKNNSILYFGTIIRKKGVLEIAPIFNKLITANKDVELIFLGRDVIDIQTGKSTLEIFKNVLNLEAIKKFKHVSFAPYKEVKKHISEAGIVLFPSFAEAFPMTWLEAMALEKRIVSSNIGWAKELMIDGETGFMVNPKNHKDFFDKVLFLLENDDKGKAMTLKARKRILTSFSQNNGTKENIELYKSVVQ